MRLRSPSSPQAHKRRASCFVAPLACLRMLAALAVFQLSAAAHLARDAVEYLLTGEHHDDEHDHGRECPPG